MRKYLQSCLCLALLILSEPVFSQNVTIRTGKREVALSRIIEDIERQTDFLFVYDKSRIDTGQKYQVNLEKASAARILDEIFPESGDVSYKINGKNIILVKREKAKVWPDKESFTLTQKVVDGAGRPVAGAFVQVIGQEKGAMADDEGVFTLPGLTSSDILTVSCMGYQDRTIQADKDSKDPVVLKDDTNLLEEVVVVGYSEQKKVNLTGSVASINFNDKKMQRPVTTIAASLSGMAAGINVMNTGSQPNAETSSVLIRGTGTLNNSSPLVLVDGMEMSLNEINPNDVASISILKDAASCAIYGNRGANGVILVTTKRGADGKVNVTYSGKFSYNTPARLIRQVSDYAYYRECINEGYENSGQATKFSQSTIDEWREASRNPDEVNEYGYPNYVTHPNTDWYSEIYRPKWMQEHTISLTGAEKKTNYSLSGTYLDNPGLVVESGVKKYYFRSDIESRVTDFLTVGMRAWGYNADQERNSISSLWGLSMQKATPGIYPYYDGMYGGPETNEEDGQAVNPLLNLSGSNGFYKQNKYNINPYVEIKFLKDLKFTSNFYFDHFINHHRSQPSEFMQQFSFNRGMSLNTPPTSADMENMHVADWEYREKSWKTSQLLTWSRQFSAHDVSVLAGYEEFRKWGDKVDVDKQGLSAVNLTDFDAMTKPYSIKGSSWEYSSRSVFGRLNYAYDNRYLVEFNLRYDGSSRFSPGSRWGLFPSVSAGWRLSEESFMEKVMWLNNLKLRASWGKLGNNSIGNYEWQALYQAGNNYAYHGDKTAGLAMNAFSSYNLEWEETAIFNVGVDFSVLDSRLSGTVEVYDKNTDGILYRPTLSETLNQFYAPLQNLAGVNNKGVELTLGWRDNAGDLSYSVSGNLTFNRNMVTRYKGKLVREWRKDADGNDVWYSNIGDVSSGGTTRIIEGHMMNEFYVLDVYKGSGNHFNSDGSVDINGGPSDGIIRTEEDMKWLRAMSNAGYRFYPSQGIGKDKIWYGDMIYADNNGDGVYGDDKDYDFQGISTTPKYYYGLQASLAWKGIDVSMSWAGSAGFRIEYYKQAQNAVNVTHCRGISKDVAYDHYFYDPENPEDPRTNIWSSTPRIIAASESGQAYANSEWHLQKGDYIKLKNLTVGYTLPEKWIKKAFLQNARLYLSGENLITITGFTGPDPEMMSGDGYLPMRQWAAGVVITF